jgi:hypothetical protein
MRGIKGDRLRYIVSRRARSRDFRPPARAAAQFATVAPHELVRVETVNDIAKGLGRDAETGSALGRCAARVSPNIFEYCKLG